MGTRLLLMLLTPWLVGWQRTVVKRTTLFSPQGATATWRISHFAALLHHVPRTYIAVLLSRQSPEIARIRSERDPPQRVSGRALRLSAAVTSTSSSGEGRQGEGECLSSSQPDGRPSSSPEAAGVQERERGMCDSDGARTLPGLDGQQRGHRQKGGGNRGSTDNQPQAGRNRQGRASRSSLDRRRGAADNAGKNVVQRSSSSPGQSGGGGESPMVTACESDIWAWALIVLQMFSDEAWPPGNGQVRCCHCRCKS